jgi:hypothetical protein
MKEGGGSRCSAVRLRRCLLDEVADGSVMTLSPTTPLGTRMIMSLECCSFCIPRKMLVFEI